MSKSRQNALLLLVVIVLIAYPLLTVRGPVAEPGKDAPAMFAGTDGQAEGMIRQLAPDYQPWAAPLMTPPGGEIESLLFALQVALGAGFLGYYLGVKRERARWSAESGPGRAV